MVAMGMLRLGGSISPPATTSSLRAKEKAKTEMVRALKP
jgi:hypothetical protein